MKFEWEDIYDNSKNRTLSIGTWRAKVIGGWLVSNTISCSRGLSIAMEFIPDQEHKWEIEKD